LLLWPILLTLAYFVRVARDFAHQQTLAAATRRDSAMVCALVRGDRVIVGAALLAIWHAKGIL
jgi:hypothetical protein